MEWLAPAELVWIEAAGHGLLCAQPEAVAEAIAKFLR